MEDEEKVYFKSKIIHVQLLGIKICRPFVTNEYLMCETSGDRDTEVTLLCLLQDTDAVKLLHQSSSHACVSPAF